jgi:hypothetical protein
LENLKGRSGSIVVRSEVFDDIEDPTIELERSMFEATVSTLDSSLCQESLIAGFLLYSALAAFVSSLLSFSLVASHVSKEARWMVFAMMAMGGYLMVGGLFRVLGVYRAKRAYYAPNESEFLMVEPPLERKVAVLAALTTEYRQVRITCEDIVRGRLSALYGGLWWAGSAAIVALVAVLLAFVSISAITSPISHGQPIEVATLLIRG